MFVVIIRYSYAEVNFKFNEASDAAAFIAICANSLNDNENKVELIMKYKEEGEKE